MHEARCQQPRARRHSLLRRPGFPSAVQIQVKFAPQQANVVIQPSQPPQPQLFIGRRRAAQVLRQQVLLEFTLQIGVGAPPRQSSRTKAPRESNVAAQSTKFKGCRSLWQSTRLPLGSAASAASCAAAAARSAALSAAARCAEASP